MTSYVDLSRALLMNYGPVSCPVQIKSNQIKSLFAQIREARSEKIDNNSDNEQDSNELWTC